MSSVPQYGQSPTPASPAASRHHGSAAAQASAPGAAAQLEPLVGRLLADDRLEIGKVVLSRNRACDCVTGVDPFGIEAVAAMSADAKGCLEAVKWALWANAGQKPRLV